MHLVAHVVQIQLELVLYVPGEVGAAVLDLLQPLTLTGAGQVKGLLVWKHVLDLVQKLLRHRLDPVQRISEVLLALPA